MKTKPPEQSRDKEVFYFHNAAHTPEYFGLPKYIELPPPPKRRMKMELPQQSKEQKAALIKSALDAASECIAFINSPEGRMAAEKYENSGPMGRNCGYDWFRKPSSSTG